MRELKVVCDFVQQRVKIVCEEGDVVCIFVVVVVVVIVDVVVVVTDGAVSRSSRSRSRSGSGSASASASSLRNPGEVDELRVRRRGEVLVHARVRQACRAGQRRRQRQVLQPCEHRFEVTGGGHE